MIKKIQPKIFIDAEVSLATGYTISDGYSIGQVIHFYDTGNEYYHKLDGVWDKEGNADLSNYVHISGDTMTGGLTINGPLSVNGDIYQTGSTWETHLNHIYTTGDTITLRDGAVIGLPTSGYTGFIAKKYDGTNDGVLVFDGNGVARVGDVGNEQPLATREEIPINDFLASWSSGDNRFNTINPLSLPVQTGVTLNYIPYTGANQNVNLGVYGVTGSTFVKNNGTASQFLMADGSVSTISDNDNRYVNTTGDTMSGNLVVNANINTNKLTTSDLVLNSDNVFLGLSTGLNVTGSTYNNFLGYQSGKQANTTDYSNFLGYNAGYQITNSSRSNFLGFYAGYQATGSYYSNFLGNRAGESATGSTYSNFLGSYAGYQANNAYSSNFLGNQAGSLAINAIFSNFFGYSTGKAFTGNNVGSNNIIIGTNISLPNATSNSMNLGGVLFGSGFYSTIGGDPSITPNNGKIGINIINPSEVLSVSGNTYVSGSIAGNSFIKSGGLSSQYLMADGSVTTGTTDNDSYVPYTGATQAVNLGAYGITGNSFIKSGGTASQYLMADGSVTTGGTGGITETSTNTLTNKTLNDLSNNIDANALHLKVFCDLGSAATILMPVTFDSWNVANSATTVKKAANGGLKCHGLMESAGADGTVQSVRLSGLIEGTALVNVNTNIWSEKTVLYVGTSGVLTSVKPASNAQAVAIVLKQHSTLGIVHVVIEDVEEADSDIYVSKGGDTMTGTLNITSGGLSVTGNTNISGSITGNTFVKSGGLSSQFLMADGSVTTGSTDNDTYLNLNQSTPQTITGGTPLMTSTVNPTGSTYQLVNKEYIDNLPIEAIKTLVYNNTGATLLKRKAVRLSGATGGVPNAILAISNLAGTQIVSGLVEAEILPGQTGYVINQGLFTDVDTSAFDIGDILYLSDVTAGEMILAPSLAITSRLNQIGEVLLKNATTGSILIRLINEDMNASITTNERNVLEGNIASTGAYLFGGITKTDSTHFAVGATKGWIVQNTGVYATAPTVTYVNYTGATGLTCTSMSGNNSYLYVDSSSLLQQTNTYPTPEQRRDNIFIGRVSHPDNATILSVMESVDYDNSPMSAMRDMFVPIKLINDGVTCYPDGSNLSFYTTSGKLYGLGINYSVDNKNPNIKDISAHLPASFSYRTQTGGSSTAVTLVDPTNYDLNGVITPVPTINDTAHAYRATNQRIYLYSTGTINIQYGQQVYDTLALALAGQQTEMFTTFGSIKENAILIGMLAVRRATTVLNDTNYAVFTPASIFGENIGGVNGISTTNLQQAYNNAVEPEILTNSTLKALTIRVGSDANTDNVYEGQNLTGSTTFAVDGDGKVTASSFVKSGGTASQFLKANGSVDSNIYAQTSQLNSYATLTGATFTGGVSATSFTKSGGTASQFLKADGSVDANTYTPTTQNTLTKEPTGFVSPELVVINYDPTSQKITLTGTITAYYQGTNISIANPTFVSGWVSPAHTDSAGHSYFLYYNGTNFVWATDSFPGYDMTLIAVVNYGATDKYAIRECHGFMPWQSHKEYHETIGTYKSSGGGFPSAYYVLNSTTATDRRPRIDETTIYDEDCPTVLPALITNSYTTYKLTGASVASYTTGSTEIIPLLTNNPYYNTFTTPNWGQTLMPSNSVATVWIYAIPVTSSAISQAYRYLFVQPQWFTQAMSSSAANILTAVNTETLRLPSELNLGSLSLETPELVCIGKIIIAFTNNWSIRSVVVLTGNKYSQIGSPSGNYLSTVATDSTLTGDGTGGSPLSVVRSVASSVVLTGSTSWTTGLTQTVSAVGVTTTNNVIISAPINRTELAAYNAAGISCTVQGTATLTFTCSVVPSINITLNILIL